MVEKLLRRALASKRGRIFFLATAGVTLCVRRLRRRRRALLLARRLARGPAKAEACYSPVEWSDDDDGDEEPHALPELPEFRRHEAGDDGRGGARLRPADARAAARWLAATHLGFLFGSPGADDRDAAALRAAVLARVTWRRYRDGATILERGAARDALVLVVSGVAELYEEADDDDDGGDARRCGALSRATSGSSQVGLDLDDGDRSTETLPYERSGSLRARREKLASTLGPMEALGKFSVVVAAAGTAGGSDDDRGGADDDGLREYRVVAGGREGLGTVTCALAAADLREVALQWPDAILGYARRCVARLHRVARFATSEFLRAPDAHQRDESFCDVAPLPAVDFDGLASDAYAPGAVVALDPDALTVLVSGAVLVGGARAPGDPRRRVEAPAVLGGFAFLDEERSRRDDALTVVADGEGSGVRVARVREASLRSLRGGGAAAVAEGVLAVVKSMGGDVRCFLRSGMTRKWLHAGARLLTEHAPTPPHFYVVISGRVALSRAGENDEDVSRGGVVGLEAVLTGAPALDFGARCVRDTELVAVPREALEDARSGALWLRKLAGHLGRNRGRAEVADEVSTLAFLGADGPDAAAAARNAAAVADALEAIGEGPPLVVGPREALAKFGDPFSRRGGHGDAPLLWRRRVTSWLAECEERHRFVVLECFDRGGGAAPKQFLRHWSRLALGNADKVVVVAHGARSRALAPRSLERRALYDRGPARSVVVLLAHEAGGPNPKRSGRWLAQRPSSARGPRLLHVVVGDGSDLARAARILAGRAVGVVLGGGGGRGLGHLGVLRALEAGGLPPDIVGGCSQGAFMAAAYALPKRTADRLEATSLAAAHIARKLTSPAALLWEATLPLVSFFDGKGFSNAVRYGLALAWTPPADRRDASTYSSESEDSDSDDDGSASDDERARRRRRRRRFAARDVEDCWLPFFCVNTNLTKQRCDVRLTGDLVFACRASMSVAELLPPARDPLSGDLHCDGCYVNNMPVHEGVEINHWCGGSPPKLRTRFR